MKQCDLTKGLVVFLTIMITFFCGVMPSAWAEDSVVPKCKHCAGQSFKGCYGFSHDGMMMMMEMEMEMVGDPPTPVLVPVDPPIPMASVGVLYSDGKGNLTGHEMVKFGPATFPANISGTYTVNADCTGTAWVCATPYGSEEGIESTISFVITGCEGEELQLLTTDMIPCGTGEDYYLPINIVGTAKKQGCDD